jgi:hypothetical protein
MISDQQHFQTDALVGTLDEPYRFAWRPRGTVPCSVNAPQYMRLLVLRGRVQKGLVDDWERAA